MSSELYFILRSSFAPITPCLPKNLYSSSIMLLHLAGRRRISSTPSLTSRFIQGKRTRGCVYSPYSSLSSRSFFLQRFFLRLLCLAFLALFSSGVSLLRSFLFIFAAKLVIITTATEAWWSAALATGPRATVSRCLASRDSEGDAVCSSLVAIQLCRAESLSRLRHFHNGNACRQNRYATLRTRGHHRADSSLHHPCASWQLSSTRVRTEMIPSGKTIQQTHMECGRSLVGEAKPSISQYHTLVFCEVLQGIHRV